MSVDRGHGLPLLAFVTSGNFCRVEQCVALAHCAGRFRSFRHATRSYRNRCWPADFHFHFCCPVPVITAASRPTMSSRRANVSGIHRPSHVLPRLLYRETISNNFPVICARDNAALSFHGEDFCRSRDARGTEIASDRFELSIFESEIFFPTLFQQANFKHRRRIARSHVVRQANFD